MFAQAVDHFSYFRALHGFPGNVEFIEAREHCVKHLAVFLAGLLAVFVDPLAQQLHAAQLDEASQGRTIWGRQHYLQQVLAAFRVGSLSHEFH